MTQNDIIRMAREAGFQTIKHLSGRNSIAGQSVARFERFAQLIAAHEREECANLCISIQQSQFSSDRIGWEHGTVDCAYAIRARGNNVS